MATYICAEVGGGAAVWRVARKRCVRGRLGTSQFLDLRGRAASADHRPTNFTPPSRNNTTIVDTDVTTLL